MQEREKSLNLHIATNQLEIITPSTNKALAIVLKNATPQELEVILKNKDLQSIINSIFKESGENSQVNNMLLELLKNNPTLKSLGDMSSAIKELLVLLDGEKSISTQNALKNALVDIKNLDEIVLKQKFENSGIFLESRLKSAIESSANNIKEILSQDFKAVLLKTSEEVAKNPPPNQIEIAKQVDKLLLQVDYFQLLSHLSSSSFFYLPFSWDGLEEGNINIKKAKNSVFYCDIELRLKECGELNLKLALYEKNQINIHFYSDNLKFKEIIKENIAALRSALIRVQITPKEIRIHDVRKKSQTPFYENIEREIDIGFEAKA